jgi:hypothetical protein
MQGVINNSSLPNKTALLEQLAQASQPNPQAQQAAMMEKQINLGLLEAQANSLNADAQNKAAQAQRTMVEASLMPEETKAKIRLAGQKKARHIITPAGEFASAKKCAEHYGVTDSLIYYWIKTVKKQGFYEINSKS